MTKAGSWIVSFRLRTLPLSVSPVILGSFLAKAFGQFSFLIFVLCILTTLFLQILSNLANDYGDMKSGADNDTRIGPARALQKGEISMLEMKRMIYIFAFFASISGLALVYYGTRFLNFTIFLVFIIIGISAIAAAVKYTVGNKPYGYRAMGDIFVLIFFGPVATMGSFFLHSGFVRWDIMLPALTTGLMSVAVLNLNNMRDMENDNRSGKVTLAGILGRKKSKVYHALILIFAIISSLTYTYFNYSGILHLIYIIVFIPLIFNIKAVIQNSIPSKLDIELKKVALTALAYSVIFTVPYFFH
ncbi:MAG: 1,4-dihydroxy-2-naphthoate octaprenyltransferase [Spirochaetota bacterium]